MKKQTSIAQVRPLALTVFLFALLSFVFFDQTKHLPALADILPFGDDPYDAVGSFSIQLTFVTACLSLIRAYRPYPVHTDDDPSVLIILKGVIVALFSTSVMLASDLIAMIRLSPMWINSPSQTLLITSAAVMIVTTGALLGWTSRVTLHTIPVQKLNPKTNDLFLCLACLMTLALYPMAWRESSVGGILTAALGMIILFITTFALARIFYPVDETPTQDFLDDLNAIYQSLKQRFNILGVLEHWLSRRWIRSVLDWFNPRKHSWRLILVIALLLGAGLLTAEILAEGLASNVTTVILVASVYLGIEGAAVGLGYLLFGRYLEIFRSE